MGIAKENASRSGVFGVDETLPASLALESKATDDRRLLEVLRKNSDTVDVKDFLEAKEGVRRLWTDVDGRG